MQNVLCWQTLQQQKSEQGFATKILQFEFPGNFCKPLFDTRLKWFSFQYPKALPALAMHESDVISECLSMCKSQDCPCTHYFNITLHNTVQIVLANIGKGKKGKNKVQGFAHPIHVHGHHLYVIKVKLSIFLQLHCVELYCVPYCNAYNHRGLLLLILPSDCLCFIIGTQGVIHHALQNCTVLQCAVSALYCSTMIK